MLYVAFIWEQVKSTNGSPDVEQWCNKPGLYICHIFLFSRMCGTPMQGLSDR